MYVKFSTLGSTGLFVKVPEIYSNFIIKQYGCAGTWLMETDTKGLNHWKESLPRSKYIVLGDAANLSANQMDSVISNNGVDRWYDYVGDNYTCLTPKESFISLMSNMNIYNDTNKDHQENLINLLKDKDNCVGEEVKLSLRMGKWIVLLEQ